MTTDASYYELSRPEIARLIIGRPRRILEIGCAAGNFRRNITWDCEYHGVEPVEAAARKAAEKDMTVHVGTYDQVRDELPDGHFDLVVANDVIEHMADPWAFLKSIRTKLAAGGCVIGSVPNVRYATNIWSLVVRREWAYSDAGVLDRTHLRFFTPKSIARTLRESGYRIDCLKPSGPDRYALVKKFLAPFAFPFGVDVLYMQIAFRCTIADTPA